jgi:hypothetical protein
MICELQALLISYHLTKGFLKDKMISEFNKDKKLYYEHGLDISRLKVVDIQKYTCSIMKLVDRAIPKYNKNLGEVDKLILNSSFIPVIINYKYDTNQCINDYLKINSIPPAISSDYTYYIMKIGEKKFVSNIMSYFISAVNINKNRRIERLTNNYPYISSLLSGILMRPFFLNYHETKNLTFSSIPKNYPWAKTLSYNYFDSPIIDGSIISLLVLLMSGVLLSIMNTFKLCNKNKNTIQKSIVWTIIYNITKLLDVNNAIKSMLHVVAYKSIIGTNNESGALLSIYLIFYKLLNYKFDAVVLK